MCRKVLLLCFLVAISCYKAQYCKNVIAKDLLGNEAVEVDCNYPMTGNHTCLGLTVNVPEFFHTNTYKVSAVNYEPVIPYNQGTPLNIVADDLFVKVIDLPFTFCFFGNNYDQLAIGTNGLVTFDLSNMEGDAISFPNIQAQNPSPLLPTNSIFGVMQDLVFSAGDDSEIYYTIEGKAPCRRVVVNFYNGKIAGCQDRSSSQIVLYEGSNEIDVFVEKKPMPCASAKVRESLIGVLNSVGNVGYSPNNRNTGVWLATNEAYKFSPSGALITPTINWYDSDKNLVANGQNVSVCPDDNQVYTAELVYNICGDTNYTLTDEIVVKFKETFPLVKNYNHIICNGAVSMVVNLDDDNFKSELARHNYKFFNYKFYKNSTDAENNVGEISPSNITIVGGEVFYVRVENPTDASCYRIATLSFELISNLIKSTAVELCDGLNDGVIENYDLQKLNVLLFNNLQNVVVSYFTSQANADANINSVNNLNLTPSTKLFVRVDVKGCIKVFGPIDVNFIPGPEINTPIDLDVEICDMIGDKIEEYDFHLNLDHLVTTDPTVVIKYFTSLEAANQGTGTEASIVRNGLQTYYVRVEFPGGCFSVGIINLNVTFKPFEALSKTVYLCFDGTQDVTIDLDELTLDMLTIPLPPAIIDKTYYLTFNQAVEGLPEDVITPIQTIVKDGNYVTTKYFVRFQDDTGCFIVREVAVTLVFPKLSKDNFEVCDVNNDQEENVILSRFSAEIIGDQPATVTYHNTKEEALTKTNPQNVTFVDGSKTMYVNITAYDCSQVYPMTIKLTNTPVVTNQVFIEEFNVCDNNNDGQEPYDLTKGESKMYHDLTAVNFKYFENYNADNHTFSNEIIDPKNYIVKGTASVFAQIIFNGSACFSVSKLEIKLNFRDGIALKPALLVICDFSFDLHESFNLSQALPQLFTQADNTIPFNQLNITYYKNEADANEGDVTKAVGINQITEFSSVVFWARFQDKINGCYSVQSIELKTYFPPKAIISKIVVCDDNVDGKIDVDLTAYVKNMVVVESDENKFSFYHTQNDALLGINKIPNPDQFSANPFPARLWVRIENIPGCKDVNYIDFEINTKVPLLQNGPFNINTICDQQNDGQEVIDLTIFETQIYAGTNATFTYYKTLRDLNNFANAIPNPTAFAYDAKLQTGPVYVMISVPGLCPDLVRINIRLKTAPVFNLPDYYFCKGIGIQIKPNFPATLAIAKYEWRNPTGDIISTLPYLEDVKTEGLYSLTLTATNGCTHTDTFEVIQEEVPVIQNLIPNNTSYTVIATGTKDILYSIDGVNWQASNVFNNLPVGVVYFYVRYKDSQCLGDIKRGLVIEIINTFTPNGDGYNDVWTLDHLNVFEGKPSTIKIVDRNGVLVFDHTSATKFEWLGQHNGRSLPSSSYWYAITLPDGRSFTGWIMLKNRN